MADIFQIAYVNKLRSSGSTQCTRPMRIPGFRVLLQRAQPFYEPYPSLELAGMHKEDDERQQLINQLLASQTAKSLDEVLEHTLWSWNRLAHHLIPLIGEAGFCALYGRAIRQTQSACEWLTILPAGEPPNSLFNSLRQDLAIVDPQIAAKANHRLLDGFTTLLSSLIGEVLTVQILNSSWTDQSDAKNTQEKNK